MDKNMTPSRAVVEAIVRQYIDPEELTCDWVHRMTEELDAALLAARREGHKEGVRHGYEEGQRAMWREAAAFVRQSFLMGPGQRTYTWSDKQTEQIAAALAARGEG